MKPTLGMIAHDTHDNILRALASAAPYVDSGYVLLSEPDRELEAKWRARELYPVAFGAWTCDLPGGAVCTAKRNVLIAHMRQDGYEWALLLDSDDEFLPGGTLPKLVGDGFQIDAVFADGSHKMPKLLRLQRPWQWFGDVHEVLIDPPAAAWNKLRYRATPRQRSAAEYSTHADALANKTDPRSVFYYAQSLRDAGRDAEALAAYVRRGNMIGGFGEENFWAWLNAGKLAWSMGFPWESVVALFQIGATWGPRRAEPHMFLARVYDAWGKSNEALAERVVADACPWPDNAVLFVDPAAYSQRELG